MKKICFLIMLIGLSFSLTPLYAKVRPVGLLKINGKVTKQIEAKKPAVLEFSFVDPETRVRIKDFEAMHGKFMHLVLIRRDLSTFAHIHPYYDASTGIFTMPLHIDLAHPDNKDAVKAIEFPGRYFVLAEVKLKLNDKFDAGIHTYTFDLDATDEEMDDLEDFPTIADPVSSDGKIYKYFDESGAIASEGAFYRVALSITSQPGVDGVNIRFLFDVYRKDENGTYVIIDELQPWLGMGSHSLLMNVGDEQRAVDKFYLHMHSGRSKNNPVFTFSHYNRGEFKNGQYKIWVQFKHKKKILTFPFLFEYTYHE